MLDRPKVVCTWNANGMVSNFARQFLVSYSPFSFRWDEINLKLYKKGTWHIDLATSMVDCDWEESSPQTIQLKIKNIKVYKQYLGIVNFNYKSVQTILRKCLVCWDMLLMWCTLWWCDIRIFIFYLFILILL